MTRTPPLGVLLMCISLGVASCTDRRASAAPAAPSPIPQPRDSFDFTGAWIAADAGPEYETDMRFAIRNNALVSLVCGSSEALTLSPPPSVRDGEFSFLGDNGIAISGQLVSPTNAVGTINVPGCTTTRWWAVKSGAIQNAGAR